MELLTEQRDRAAREIEYFAAMAYTIAKQAKLSEDEGSRRYAARCGPSTRAMRSLRKSEASGTGPVSRSSIGTSGGMSEPY